MYDKVLIWVWQRMQELCGDFAGNVLGLSSTGRDFSTFAITDGVRFWADQEDWPIQGWDGFRVINGQFGQAPAGIANDTMGQFPFTVPAQPGSSSKALTKAAARRRAAARKRR